MIARPRRRADTGWYRPACAVVRGRDLDEPLRGGPKRGDRVVADSARYRPVSGRIRA